MSKSKVNKEQELAQLQAKAKELKLPYKGMSAERLRKMVDKKESSNGQQPGQLSIKEANEKTLDFLGDVIVKASELKENNVPIHAIVLLSAANGQMVTLNTPHTPLPLCRLIVQAGNNVISDTMSSAIAQDIIKNPPKPPTEEVAQVPKGSNPPQAPAAPESKNVKGRDPKETKEIA